jgi:hypothetical protein
LESLSDYTDKPTGDSLRLQKIEQQIPLLTAQNARTQKFLEWGLVILVVLLVIVVKRIW